MKKYIYVGFSYNDLSIMQKAVDEMIYSLSQDRFFAEQAERYSDADAIREKLTNINKVRRRLKNTREHLIHLDVLEQVKKFK